MFHKLTSIKYIILAIFLLFPSVALARVKPTTEFYINDYANVITEETEKYILDQNVLLNEKTGAQIVVVTVPSLDGEDIEGYANGLFRDFGIGDKEKNNGLLILISTGDRKVKIEVGYGLEETITDGKSGRILDNYMVPSLKNNDYDTATRKGFDVLFNEILKFYGLNDLTVDIEEIKDEEDVTAVQVVMYILVIIVIICLSAKIDNGSGYYGGYSGGGFHSGGGHHSGGGFHGGGGSSGGGGASRGF